MDMTHLQPFLDAMHRRDPAALPGHMTEDVILRSPILADPVQGRTAVGRLLAVLLQVADSFTVTDLVAADSHAAVFVTIRCGAITVDGVDDMHVDAAGLVASMTIQWRPLPALVAMQQRLAPLIGAPALTLVPA